MNQSYCLPKCEAAALGGLPAGIRAGDEVHGGVKVVDCMTQLGLVQQKGCRVYADNVKARLAKARAKNGIILGRLSRIGCHHDVYIGTMLAKADTLQTLLYGACIWGHHGLVPTAAGGGPMQHAMQSVLTAVPRAAMQLPACVGNWIVALLSGLMPVQYYIVQRFITFWNSLCEGGTPLTVACRQAQIDMLGRSSGPACWLKRWSIALDTLLPYHGIHDKLVQGRPLDASVLLQSLEDSYKLELQSLGDPFEAGCSNRRTAFVYRVILGDSGKLGAQPPFLRWRLSDSVRRVWFQFCSASAAVPVHTLRVRNVPFVSRICTLCTEGVVGDEQHVLLTCPATESARFAPCSTLAL